MRLKNTPEYRDYVLESAYLQRQIQSQLDDEKRLESENAALDQFYRNKAISEMLKYCKAEGVNEEDVMTNFEEHLPNLRKQIKPVVMKEFLNQTSSRSAIMETRIREVDDMFKTLNSHPREQDIINRYFEAVNDYSIFGQEELYKSVTNHIFQHHMQIMRSLLVS